ncbi:uncharacterized protein BCR38DRAFT_412686 [Pseudomassariella vexata]|uniref:Uncharacterized protein n=1 Tax=Pseudomassariella vexata TaxID=1141098 RepID=A0A1Y2DKI1_9PEZI|nr:uncharacterized protein BCR38DRAFT_412686 [Pseudomassariella vexata]ORY59689.1 hypothetical protein BCR38DRAFT_412686 [Pseudomassariella vexata]
MLGRTVCGPAPDSIGDGLSIPPNPRELPVSVTDHVLQRQTLTPSSANTGGNLPFHYGHVSTHLIPSMTPPPADAISRKSPMSTDRKRATIANQARACITTHTIIPPQKAGPTSTVYQYTVTRITRLDCAGCTLMISTQVQGFGPPPAWQGTPNI